MGFSAEREWSQRGQTTSSTGSQTRPDHGALSAILQLGEFPAHHGDPRLRKFLDVTVQREPRTKGFTT